MTVRTDCCFSINEGLFFYRREQLILYNAHTCRQVISMSDTFGGGHSAFFKGTSRVPTLEAIDNYEPQLLVGTFQKAIIETEYCN